MPQTYIFRKIKIFVFTNDFEFFVLGEAGEILKNLRSSFDVYLEIDNVRYMNDNLAIRAVDVDSMTEQWRLEVGPYGNVPVFDNGTIFIVTWNNEIYSFSFALMG